MVEDEYIIRSQITDLKVDLRNSWARDTAFSPFRWNPDVPETGQCAVTALVVQDFFGGDLVRGKVTGFGSHYWNRIPGVGTVDLTWSQFPNGTLPPVEDRPVSRLYVLLGHNTVDRYARLLGRVLHSYAEREP